MPKTDLNLYYYRAHVTSVYDGDTFTAVVDLGFHLKMEMHFRMLGINTPEIKTGTPDSKKKAVEAREYLRSLILDKDVVIKSDKDKTEKYDRYLGTVFIDQVTPPNAGQKTAAATETVNVNQTMIDKGYAQPFMTDEGSVA